MSQTALVYTPRFNDYDLGPSHPLKPARVVRTYNLIRACAFLEHSDVSVVQPSTASEEMLALAHSTEYIEAVRAPVEGRRLRNPLKFGLGTVDNPIVEGMYEATAIVVGASVKAADVVFEEAASIAFNPGGGLHHAHHSKAAGFCVFNDIAVAIAHLLNRCGDGVKVAYVDIDAHHGDGVQEAFYDRRDVLTISLHESGRYLFPGTGRVEDIGEGEGEGFSVNLPLSPFTSDEVYVWAFQEGIVPLLEAFEDHFRGLDEALARLVHVHAEALELDAPEAATDAEDDAAVRHAVEHRDLLGDADGIVPRQHHHHGAELDPLAVAADAGQELHGIRGHGVVREVMLHRPNGFEAQ